MTGLSDGFDPLPAALAGAALGVASAATGVLALDLLDGRPVFTGGKALGLLLVMTAFGGPGAFLIGIPFSAWLHETGSRKTRQTVLGLSLIVGPPLGVLNLVLLLAFLGFLTGRMSMPLVLLQEPQARMFLLPALLGGAGLGAGCAWGALRR